MLVVDKLLDDEPFWTVYEAQGYVMPRRASARGEFKRRRKVVLRPLFVYHI